MIKSEKNGKERNLTLDESGVKGGTFVPEYCKYNKNMARYGLCRK